MSGLNSCLVVIFGIRGRKDYVAVPDGEAVAIVGAAEDAHGGLRREGPAAGPVSLAAHVVGAGRIRRRIAGGSVGTGHGEVDALVVVVAAGDVAAVAAEVVHTVRGVMERVVV